MTATASSEEDGYYKAQCAVDGDFNTRWSSAFTDAESLTIDLGDEQRIAGLTLFWENAWAKRYCIRCSRDGKRWETAAEEQYGDGNTDEVFFAPRKVRFVTIDCLERGTQWGNSLYEVTFRQLKESPKVYCEKGQGAAPDAALDGRYETAAQIVAGDALMIDLRKETELSGVYLFWRCEDSAGFMFDVFVSVDGATWDKVTTGKNKRYQANKTDCIRDQISFSSREARYVKIAIGRDAQTAGTGSVELTEVRLKHIDDVAGSFMAVYEHLAQSAQRGLFPLWLLKEQEYWIVLGVPQGAKEVAVSEFGRIENGFSVEPFVQIGTEIVTWNDVAVTQELAEGWMPITRVMWTHPAFTMTEEVFCSGTSDASTAVASFTLRNTGSAPLDSTFYLTIRPFKIHPLWLYGGLAPIVSMTYDAATETLAVNGVPRIRVCEKPDGIQMKPFSERDVALTLDDATAYVTGDVECRDQCRLVSAAVKYAVRLAPGEARTIEFTMPVDGATADQRAPSPHLSLGERQGGVEPHGQGGGFLRQKEPPSPEGEGGDEGAAKGERDATIAAWKSLVEKVEITVPDQTFVDTMKAQLAYTFVHMDDGKFKPGSRVYEKTWMRDSAITAAALLRFGHPEIVRDFLLWMARMQYENGMIPFTLDGEVMPGYVKPWKEYDSQGEFMYAVAEYYRFTHDAAFVQTMLPHIERAVAFLESVREPNDDTVKPAFRGILKESNSHEGYFPAVHSNFDNMWALRGLRDAAFLARAVNDEVRYQQWDVLARDFAVALGHSVETVMEEKKIDYVPACAEKGDFDPPATMMAVFPCAIEDALPAVALQRTFDKFYTDVFSRHRDPQWEGTFTAYELRLAFPFLMRGESNKAWAIVSAFLDRMYPKTWRMWGETVFTNIREPQYIGDLPHGWVSVDFLNLARSMFVYEKDEKLVLAAGVPDEWIAKGFSVSNMPTWYGTLSYTVTPQSDGTATITVTGDANPPQGFECHNLQLIDRTESKS